MGLCPATEPTTVAGIAAALGLGAVTVGAGCVTGPSMGNGGAAAPL